MINRLDLMRLFQQHGVKAPGQAYRRAVRVESGEDPMPDFPPSEMSEWTSGQDGEREILRTATPPYGLPLNLSSSAAWQRLGMEVAGTVGGILAQKVSTVWSIAPTAMVFDAIALMADKNIGALPVVENDK